MQRAQFYMVNFGVWGKTYRGGGAQEKNANDGQTAEKGEGILG